MDWALPTIALALLGFAAVSGRLEGTPITAPMVFTAVGLFVGAETLGLVDPTVSSEAVKLLAEATLALVLFGDASRIDLHALRDEVSLPARLLGLGLPLTLLVGFAVGLVVLGSLSWPEALLLAVILAPTDAALGQAVVTLPRLPSRVRQGLNVESGLNDGICVPLFFIVLAVAQAEAGDVSDVAAFRLVVRGDRLRHRWAESLAGVLAAAVVVLAGGRRLVDGPWLQVVPSLPLLSRLASPMRSAAPVSSRRSSAAWSSAASVGARRRSRLPDRGARRRPQRGHVHRLRRRPAWPGARRRRPGRSRSTPFSA